MNPSVTIDDSSSNSNIQSNFDEIEIIRIQKTKKSKFKVLKKIFGFFKFNKRNKKKKNTTNEIENEITNYNTITGVSCMLPSSLIAVSSSTPLYKNSTSTVKFIPTQNHSYMPSILNHSLFESPMDDTISEADTEITLVESFDSSDKDKKKSTLKRRKRGKKKEDIKKKNKRRHSWQDTSFNEHLEDPRNCKTITNVKDILNGAQQVELHHEMSSSSFEVIMDKDLASELKKFMPKFYRETCNHWYLEYSLGEHGASITTFYENQMYCESPIVVVISDSYGKVFGAYLNEPFNPNNSGFNGNRECFLWKKTSSSVDIYRATALNEYYMLSDPDFIAMGVDGNGVFGLFLDNMLLNGESSPCDTYLNEILSSKKRFECSSLEVWSIQYE